MNEKLEDRYIVEYDPSGYGFNDDSYFEVYGNFADEESAISYFNSQLLDCISDFIEDNYFGESNLICVIKLFYKRYRIRKI